MKAIFSLLLTLPGLAQANLCMESASPVIKQFQAQKTWAQETVQDPNVALKLEGFVDAYNQFYPEGFSQRVSQKAELLLDPKNENNKMFKSFCSQYEDRGPYLTSARVAQAMNNYVLKVQLLPSVAQYSNRPYESLKTHRVSAQIEIDPDSLIGRLPLIHEIRKEIQTLIDAELAANSKAESVSIRLLNWDDLACDLVQGKVRIAISKEMYSESNFITRQENIPVQDVNNLYRAWRSQVDKAPTRDELMFVGGAIFATLKEKQKIGAVQPVTAFKMIKSLVDMADGKIKSIGQQEMSCLYDSLQSYESEHTQYQITAEISFDKDQTLQGQE